MAHEDKYRRLEELREASRQGGGEQAIARQHERGKLTARERIDLLLDEDGLASILTQHRNLTGKALLDEIYASLVSFRGSEEFPDDISAVALEFR